MEYSIIKKGRRGFIRPFPPKALASQIESRCSYTKQGAEFMPNPAWAHVKMYKIKSASFPWGLVHEILECCKLWKFVRSEDTFKIIIPPKDEFMDTVKVELSPHLREYQIEAIKQLLKHGGGILCMPTGAGKTFTCIEYLNIFKVPTAVIVHTVGLKEQWEAQVPSFVDVITYQSIKNPELLNQKYDIIVFDECHHVAAKTLYDLSMKLKNQIVIGLSATPNREDGEDMKVFGALGQIIFSVELRSLIDQNFLVDAEVFIHTLEPYESEFYQEYQDYYRDYIVENEERNVAICQHAQQYRNKKVLILVSQIDHGEKLFEMLNGTEDVVFLNSKSKYRDYKSRVIIATSILDEGIDIPDAEVIIMAAGGKSSIKITQRIGRILRKAEGKEKALIIDFNDKCKYLDKHFLARKKLYDKYEFRQTF